MFELANKLVNNFILLLFRLVFIKHLIQQKQFLFNPN